MMRAFWKNISFLLALVLFTSSVRIDTLSISSDYDSQKSFSTTTLSAGISDVLFLPNQANTAVDAPSTFVYNKIDNQENFNISGFCFDATIGSLSSGYINRMAFLCPGLSVRDIIFPFHFFG
jgi:hypothetical protein